MILNLKRISENALNLLYPGVCPVCGSILTGFSVKDSPNPFICSKCAEVLVFPSEPRCLCCSRPITDELAEFCKSCSGEHKYFDQGTALLMHDVAAQKIIYDLKFSNKRDNADMLAYEAAARCRRQIQFWNPDMIIPVPLNRKKERDRGFNQALLLAEKLSHYLEKQGIAIPVCSDILARVKSTKPMKTLNTQERRANIRGAFRVVTESGKKRPAFMTPDPKQISEKAAASGKCSGRSILLVDDIYTSGSTLSECARVLKNAGAESVYFLTFSIG